MPSFLSTTKKKIVETFEGFRTQYNQTIIQSNLISRDLSWLKFNDRVLDQAKKEELSLPERLKFMAITASNLDEFFTIRVGSLYNYLDYGKQRVDYSGLKEHTFRKVLLSQIRKFRDDRNELFKNELLPLFPANGLELISMSELTEEEMEEVMNYFDFTIYPMLTPMLYDQTHAFPILLAKSLIFAVVSDSHATHPLHPTNLDTRKLSFVQIPPNLPRFLHFVAVIPALYYRLSRLSDIRFINYIETSKLSRWICFELSETVILPWKKAMIWSRIL